jgi:hypothetical protein
MGTAEADLITAFTQLQAVAVDELVLDMLQRWWLHGQPAGLHDGQRTHQWQGFLSSVQQSGRRTPPSRHPFLKTSFYYDANFNPTRIVPCQL